MIFYVIYKNFGFAEVVSRMHVDMYLIIVII
jgi:hypothetical protein